MSETGCAAPLTYFSSPKPVYELDIENLSPTFSRLAPQAPVIVGGGGLYFFNQELNRLTAQHHGPVIAWGIGHNTTFGTQPAFVNESRFSLIGIRDWDAGLEWVPCVSCMAPQIDVHRAKEPKHDVVVFEHKDHPLGQNDLPVLSNRCTDFDRVLEFLSSGQTVITNSYHGAYWSQMLGRRVVVVAFSTRFLRFRFPLTIAKKEDALASVAQSRAHPEALEICRERNREFADKVSNLFGCPLISNSARVR